jgi:hypothetical protein
MKEYVLKKLLGSIGPILLQILGIIKDRHLFDDLLDWAQALVQAHENNPAYPDGASKQAAVSEAIKSKLSSIGKDAAPFLINLAIELVVGALTAQGKINK